MPTPWMRRRAGMAPVLCMIALLGATMITIVAADATAARSPWRHISVVPAGTVDLGAPVALGTEGVAGPWRMTVLEVLTGDAATEVVTSANSLNDAPRDGFTYVGARLRVTNAGEKPLAIASDDFAITGGDGFIRRFVGTFAPDDAIDREVAPSESHEGWVILGAPSDETGLVLIFDSLSLPGNWADQAFALSDGAALAEHISDAAPNDTGVDPASPAGVGAAVITGEWQIELLEVVVGDPVYALYPPSDYRTTALGEAAAWDPNDADADGAVGWLAIRVRVTSLATGVAEAELLATAFMLAGDDGGVIPNTLFLTPPRPDASGPYIPGVAREGWVAFELPGAYAYTSVRFLLYRTDSDARYFTADVG